MKRAVVYTRISQDQDGTSTAPERQEADCRAFAERHDLEVIGVYEDRDTSAYDKKITRPAFERLVTDMHAGSFDVVLCWKSDRLARQPRDLERFIDAAERGKGELLSVTEPAFSGSSGLLILRMFIAFASHESGVKSERIARKSREIADGGAPHVGGRRAYGYTQHYEVVPEEAAIFREAVDRVLSGERVNAIVSDFNHRGLRPAFGDRWTAPGLNATLKAAAHAGIRAHLGRLIPGTWEPLISPERYEHVLAVLGDRTRSWGYVKTVTKHMLTGLARCGICGAAMGGSSRGKTGRDPLYRCKGCGKVSIDIAKLEGIVAERFLHVVSTPAFGAMVAEAAGDGPQDTTERLRQLREDEAALEQLDKDYFIERSLPRHRYQTIKDGLEARMVLTRQEITAQASPLLTLPTRDDGALTAEWQRRDAAWKRSVLETVVRRIVVAPARSRYEERVTVEWII